MYTNLTAPELRFGMSLCSAQNLTPEDFLPYAKAGVEEIELSFHASYYNSLDFAKLKKAAASCNLHLWSFHLPFLPFDQLNIASLDPDLRQHSVNYLSEFVKKAADIGIKIMVIHPSGEPNEDTIRKEALKYAQSSLAQLSAICTESGATLAVENLPRTCLGRDSNEIRQLLAADNHLRVCFDTNHLLIQSSKDFIADVGDYIITTHFSDYDFINERHWLPGEGKIDWKELIEALEAVNYTGPVLYEVGFQPPASIHRRPLTCDDFKCNHHELINKLPPTPIGQPCI